MQSTVAQIIQFEPKVHNILQHYSLLSILLEAYIDVPPMYFPIPGRPLGNENILLSCPPPVLHNTWGDMIVENF